MTEATPIKHPVVSKDAANAANESTLGTKVTSMPSVAAADLKKPQMPHNADEPDLCGKEDVIKGKWKVVEKIGAGCFGQIYLVRDVTMERLAAMKVESALKGEKAQLPVEVQVLKKFQGKSHATALYGSGTDRDLNFIVMERVGENLQSLRRSSPHELQRFSMSTSVRLWKQCQESIQQLHSVHIVHRDIKPSNFAMGRHDEPNKNTVYLLDFGLARFFADENGVIKPERTSVGFRGTMRYCSLTAHYRKDISRKDDLVSLFYMCSEFLKGSLPWRLARTPKEVEELKEQYALPRLLDFPQMQAMGEHLLSLKYQNEPDYTLLLKWLDELIKLNNIDPNGSWDWEENFVSAPAAAFAPESEGSTDSISDKSDEENTSI